MDNYLKISVITVCYNSAKTIEQTINSVVNQTYQNIEYIIIDGGSTDETVDIIKKYEDKIAYWVSESDRGIYDAMNKGINMASGKYVCFLGADDCFVDENTVDGITKYLVADDSIDILSGQVWVVDDETNLQKIYSNKFTNEDVYNGYVIHHQGLFSKTGLLNKYNFDTEYTIVGDYDFFLKCYFNTDIKFKYIDQVVSFYSNSGISNISQKRIAEHIEVMKKYNLSDIRINNMSKAPNCFQRIQLFVKNYIKKFLKSIGCFTLLKKTIYYGCERHTCGWNKCRWCKRF